MTLSIGSTIGGFEVVSLLGVGGMGEVYRARDRKLNRDVALKVLPASVTHDSQRVSRFRREAQVLASVSHPNIGAIHGLEDADGVTALILELVEGPTLADRIARGPLPLGDAVRVASQIASALGAAHEQGIVHRDLKPANIKLKADGTVKVLDFGLAKAIDPVDAASDLSTPATMPAPTMAGVVLGTAAYMSPEQARGQPVDKRTDVWAFGCVLFEMLTGTPAFAGEHVTDILANVLRNTPNWTGLPLDARSLLPVLQLCLEKDPSLRLRDVVDAQLFIADAVAKPDVAPAGRGSATKRKWPIAIGVGLGIAAGALAMMVFQQSTNRTVQTPQRRFELQLSADHPLASELYGTHVAVSPDGSRLVYVSRQRGVPQLVMRRLDRPEETTLAAAQGGFDPFFSPDGQHIGFATFTELKRLPTAGGPSVTICPVDAYFSGASWGDDNTIVFAEASLGLFRVAASGGKPERIALPDAANAEQAYFRPSMLPGSESVLYTAQLTGGSTRIVGRRLREQQGVTIAEGAFGPLYVSRRVLFGQADRLMATNFDPATLRTVGSPVAIASGVLNRDGTTDVAAASDGAIVYVSGVNPSTMNRLAWVDRSGAHVPITTELEYPRFLRISPDGKRLALTVGPGGLGQIWIYDLGGAAQPTKLTFQNHNLFPTWSPDGKQIAFLSRIGSEGRLLVLPADGSAMQAELLIEGDIMGVPTAWSPDGQFLFFVTQLATSKAWLLTLRDRAAHQWLQTPFSEWNARFSPDGRWVAYASDQTSVSEVWMRPFPGPGVPVRISSEGGQKPLWSRDGKEIFYENGPRLMVSRVNPSEGRAEPPRVLFEGGFMHDDQDPNMRYVDAGVDGRLLVVESKQTPSDASIVVAQHWDEPLERK